MVEGDTSPHLTQVLFPRFEHETNPEADINSRKVELIPARPWLSPAEVQVFLTAEPREGDEEDARGNWWGVYHTIREVVSADHPVQSPAMETELFRSQRLAHSFAWDSGVPRASATEIVLQRWQHDDEAFTDVVAILIGYRVTRGVERNAEQRLAFYDEGRWREPDMTPAAFRNSFEMSVWREIFPALLASL